MWGAFRTNAMVSGANPSYTVDELAYQLEVLSKRYKLKGLITHPNSLETSLKAAQQVGIPNERIVLMSSQLDRLAPPQTPSGILTLDGMIQKYAHVAQKPLPIVKLTAEGGKDKVAFLSFSSGTTGLPKAVQIPHRAVIANMIIILRHMDEDVSGERIMAVLPYYHIFGLVVVLHSSLYRGMANVIAPQFSFKPFLENIIRYRVSRLCLVPPMVVLMVKHPAGTRLAKEIQKSLKSILCGAAPLTQELFDQLLQMYPNVRIGQGYGMTETATWVTGLPSNIEPARGASVGVIGPNIQLKIIDPSGTPVGFGHKGEVLIKSPSNAIGYLANPKATAETFDQEGFVHTGDEGYVDSHGWVYVVDRLKELIKVKGNQLAPAELEGLLLNHSAVADVCVIGVPDTYSGEVARAYIVVSEEAQNLDRTQLAVDLAQFVSSQKIRYKWLDGGIEFVESIPKNPSGKILRRVLRDQYKASLNSSNPGGNAKL
ncbi:uncharacterized protein MELLADRAFT_44923 [Melampsora larici-populina 98AG31]|uniref:Uncharacterized protein n=1 Tax=Melampsora larici-populina (strain 98AG31 / pathotype 3-4-7) TaxID=747676 RepID=F4RZP7_MELLP|nr:uncharacterized protein MELLADRAFT_44923 [Melampsora larici-populina 98AG31]EGG02037.1 hypothetical protein MELLADRAFT_44923 [Melampsora larici-populina 98AG31]